MILELRHFIRHEVELVLERRRKKKKVRNDEIAATNLGGPLTGMTGGIKAFWNTTPKYDV